MLGVSCMQMKESSIINFKMLVEGFATSGQPSEDELLEIAKAGYEVVINLGLSNAGYSVRNEEKILKSKGIKYIHIPVEFEFPKSKDFQEFVSALNRHKESKVFIHCAANKRVSVFIALYRILELGWEKDKAMYELEKIWRPNSVWGSFIERQLTNASS